MAQVMHWTSVHPKNVLLTSSANVMLSANCATKVET